MKVSIDKKTQMPINLFSGIFGFIVGLGINFFLSPYIVKNIGVEANGFVTLANDFVSYATLLTIALNSMASRFITIEFHKGNVEKASKYYTSVFFGNIVIVLILLIPALKCIQNLDSLINIPSNIIWDVKVLFFLIFLNFFIATGVPNWSVCFFVTNNLYKQSICTIFVKVLRVILLVLAFSLFNPHLYYIGLTAFIITIVTQLWACVCKRRLVPEISIKFKYYDFKCLIELVSSGIYNTITQLGTLLLSGLDLVISNIFIGPVEMGILSIVKFIPNTISSLATTISGVFNPALTISYAKNDNDLFIKELRVGVKTTSALLTIVISGLIVWGYDFFKLWQPTQNAYYLQVLSVLSCLSYAVSNSLQCIYNVFSVTNKLKLNAFVLVLTGTISTFVMFLLLKHTNLGLYAVVSVSSVINIIRHFVYTIPHAARCINRKWTTFYSDVFLSLFIILVQVILGLIMRIFISADTWVMFFVAIVVFACICMSVNCFVLLNKEHRKKIFMLIKK